MRDVADREEEDTDEEGEPEDEDLLHAHLFTHSLDEETHVDEDLHYRCRQQVHEGHRLSHFFLVLLGALDLQEEADDDEESR